MAIYSGFSHWTWWFSIAMLNYQRVLEWMFLLHLKKSTYHHISVYITVYHRIWSYITVCHHHICHDFVPKLFQTQMLHSHQDYGYFTCFVSCTVYIYMYTYIYIYSIYEPGPRTPTPPPSPPQWYPPPLLTPPTPPKPSICMLFAHIHTHIHIYTPLSTRPTSHLYVICSTWEPRPRQRTLSTCIFLS